MAQVTGGVVKYGRTIKTGDYENKRADVELSFSIEDGEREFEGFLDQVANAAITKIHTMLEIQPIRRISPPASGSGTKAEGLPSSAPATGEEPAPARLKDLELTGRIDMAPKDDPATMDEQPQRTKADLAAEKIASVSDPAEMPPLPDDLRRDADNAPPKRRGRTKNTDPAAIDPSPAAGALVQQTEATDPAAITAEPPSQEDGGGSDPASIDGDVFTAAAPEITDGELQAMIAGHNAKTQATQAIRELIGKYTGGPPKTFRDIPREVRSKFREELEAIKAPAQAAA